MENIDERCLENDATYQFLRNLSLPAESSSKMQPPKKRTKNQNWYPIDKISRDPEYFDFETIRNGNSTIKKEIPSRKEKYLTRSSNIRYSKKIRTHSKCVRQSNFVALDDAHPQKFERDLSHLPSVPELGTGLDPSTDEKLTNIDAEKAPRCKLYKGCTLYPPRNGNVPIPKVERPLGCKTVLITGLTQRMTSDMVKEVFSDCGKIHKIRRRKAKNVVQITYSRELSVDKVLKLNGYKVIGVDLHENCFKGVIQVDFMPVGHEQQDYKMGEQPKTSNKNESLVPPYSDFSKEAIGKILKEVHGRSMNDHATNVLVGWMEKGECNKNNSHLFLDVLCAMQNSVYKLNNETVKLEESVRHEQSSLRAKYASNSSYFVEILKVFKAATSKSVFNNFSSNMKNRIEKWKKYIEDINKSNSQNSILEVVKDEEVLPDSKLSAQNSLVEQQLRELKHLKAENKRLKKELRVAQREAYKRQTY